MKSASHQIKKKEIEMTTSNDAFVGIRYLKLLDKRKFELRITIAQPSIVHYHKKGWAIKYRNSI